MKPLTIVTEAESQKAGCSSISGIGGETTAPRRNRKQSNPNAKLGGHASIVSEAKKNSV